MATITLPLFTLPYQSAPFICGFHATELPSPLRLCVPVKQTSLRPSPRMRFVKIIMATAGRGSLTEKAEGQAFQTPEGRWDLIFRPSTARFMALWWFSLGLFFSFFLQMSLTEFILAFVVPRMYTDLSFAGNIASQWVCHTLVLLPFLKHRHLLGVKRSCRPVLFLNN